MEMRAVVVAAVAAGLLVASAGAATFPVKWTEVGECLDDNVGPLIQGVSPQENPNVVGEAIKNITNVAQCAEECTKEDDCKFFTFYKNKISIEKRAEFNCSLVGFNLRQACFNLEDTCVLMRSCQQLDANCTSCKTGMRPFYSPANEPWTLVINGVSDNRNFKADGVDQYSEDNANIAEIVGETATCAISNTDLLPRMGSAAAYYVNQDGDDFVLNCGGYSHAIEEYLPTCQSLEAHTADWENVTTANLNQARAFATMTAVSGDTGSKVYIMGGYDKDAGFLKSIEVFTHPSLPGNPGWAAVDAAKDLKEKKSHFCAVYTTEKDSLGNKWMYVMGGWNIDYLDKVQRIKVDETTGDLDAAGWEEYSSGLQEARSDHACAEIQYNWKKGIMVAGGYRTDGAWMTTVEFLNLETGEWESTSLFPRLKEGRHYNGLASIGLMPVVFGGWNNGSRSDMEVLNVGAEAEEWKTLDLKMDQPREKFAVTRVPREFYTSCP